MLHDVVIAGAGPVGATLALALAAGEVDVVALDARPARTIARGDRSLALSHGSRLIYERLGIWGDIAAVPDAVTPITAIDISQRGGFGTARLDARASSACPRWATSSAIERCKRALDPALARAAVQVEHEFIVERIVVDTRRTLASRAVAMALVPRGPRRLAAVADGGGDIVAGVTPPPS